MRLSDLLGAEVLDAAGEPVGKIRDVRLVRDGPVQGVFGPGYRVQGLVVGGGAFGARLGFDRRDVRGPLPLKLLFRRLHRKARFVEWPLVEALQDRVVRIRAARADLPPVPRLTA